MESGRFGPYVALREIGRGGSSVVYEAHREGDARTRIALKVGHASADDAEGRAARARFLNEARRLSRIDHPAVVRVVEAGELPDGTPFIAMELCEGESLASRLARGPLPLDEATKIFEGVADGLQTLHDDGLLHRDLKPENVMLVDEGEGVRPVLIDLGIAKDTRLPASTTTQSGVVRGTPASMAPERFFGQSASIATDVYEAGLLFYAMVAGRPPWDDGADVDQRLDAKPLSDIADVPVAMSDVVMRALAMRAARRPASVRAFTDDLGAARHSPSERRATEAIPKRTTAPPPAGESAPRSRRRLGSSRIVSAVAGAVVGAGGLALLFTLATKSPPRTAEAIAPSPATESAEPGDVTTTAAIAEAPPPVMVSAEPAPVPLESASTVTEASAARSAARTSVAPSAAAPAPIPRACIELDNYVCAKRGPDLCAKARANTKASAPLFKTDGSRDGWARECRLTRLEYEREEWSAEDRNSRDARKRLEFPAPQ